jgi:hypothetical protein
VKFLVDKGADVHAHRKSSHRTSEHAYSPIAVLNGFTSLLIASQFGYPEIVKFLVERGADVNVPGTSSHGMSESFMCAHLNFRQRWMHQPLHCLSKGSPSGCEVPGSERCKHQCQRWV